ncbi:hypothetical protein K439DRAFT_1324126 [Ramaria rubella]|nr:hypothetical protein K439DRAFT_1324126 [Ramaria rubella]
MCYSCIYSSSHQQWPGPARPHTPAEHVKAAANGRTPSRTLWFAATGSTSSVLDGGARNAPHTTVQIVDSGGLALEEADRALFSHQRPANQRIHWMFSPTKDERVSSLLDWIQAMSHALATVGLHKYLRSQKRGALMANADFRPWKSPNDPAFDWLTFDDVVDTHDKTLQESMAFYEPESQVLVFVFLLSPSGNSLAMWRRKLPVPNAVRSQHRAEITKLTSALAKRKYVITVDE